MPLSGESTSAAKYLVPGVLAGLVSFAFSRVLIEPLIGTAVDYEGAREHAEAELTGGDHGHGHELFTRTVQENLGAAVGIVAFAIVMGVLFAVAHTVLRAVLERRGYAPDLMGLALALAAGMFVAIAFVPGLKYPANPPTVGLDETVGARSSAFLTITVVSVVAAIAAVALGVAWARRWGTWRSGALAAVGYATVMLVAAILLPGFREVPGPLAGPDGLVLDGFPAEVLADFRLYTLLNHAVMWLAIGAVWAWLATSAQPRASSSEATMRSTS